MAWGSILGAVLGPITGLIGAKIQSNAAKKVAAIQSASADKALAAQKAGYESQRADFEPYQQAGAAALGRLGATAGTFTGGMPQQPQMPQQGGLGQLGQPPQGQAQMGGMSPQMGQAVPQQPGGGPMPGSLVRVKAPNGQIAMLPRDMAQRAVEKGAQVIQ